MSNRRQGRRDREAKRAPRPAPDPLRRALQLGVTALVLFELVVGLLPPSNWSWGANLLHYYPPIAAVGWCLAALALVWWPPRGTAHTPGEAPSFRVTPLVGALFAAVVALLVLHAFRAQSHLLGDGYEIIRRLRQGTTPAPRAALFNALAPLLFELMGGRAQDGGGAAAMWFAILSGSVAAAATVAAGLRLARRSRPGAAAAMALLILTPILQIFAGYIESYASFHAGAIIFFAFAFDRLLGGGVGSLVGATAGLATALGSHPFAATLVPGWLYLLATPAAGPPGTGAAGPGGTPIAPGASRARLLLGVAGLAALVALAALVFAIWPALRAPNSPWRYLAPQELFSLAFKLLHHSFGIRPWSNRYTVLSFLHASDVVNTAWLVGAPGIALLAALGLTAEGRRALRSAPARLALAALPGIVICRIFMRTPLGAERDWDVFAGLGFGLNALAAGALLALGRRGLFRLAATAGLVLALPFVGIQMSAERSARRHFDAIEAEPGPEPFVESGYHGVMGDRFCELGRYDLAARAYERSLKAYPRKDYAWRLGTVEMALKHYDRAARALERTLQINPYHREALTELGNALNGLGRFSRADSVLGVAIERYPQDSGLAMVYRARARYLMGDVAGGNTWLAAAERTLPVDDAGQKDLKMLRDEVAEATRAGAAPSPAAVDPGDTPPNQR